LNNLFQQSRPLYYWDIVINATTHSTTTIPFRRHDDMSRHDHQVTPSRNDANACPSHHHHILPPPPPLFTTTTSFHHHHDTSKHDRHAKRQRRPHAPQTPRHEANSRNDNVTTCQNTTTTANTTTTPRRKQPQRVERRATTPGHTKDSQGRAKRGQTAGRTRYARFFLFYS